MNKLEPTVQTRAFRPVPKGYRFDGPYDATDGTVILSLGPTRQVAIGRVIELSDSEYRALKPKYRLIAQTREEVK